MRKAERIRLDKRIVDRIIRDGPFSTRELSDYFGFNVSSMIQKLCRLSNEGKLTRTFKGRKSYWRANK
jgi:hypothetical protein